MYREDDRIDYAAREKYKSMTPEECEKLLSHLENEARKKVEQIRKQKKQ